MPRIFNVPFATQGDRTEVPEDTQSDGSVSLTQGFGFDYEREYEDPDAKDIARDVLNGLLYDITQAIGHLQSSNIQFANYDPERTYETGEVVRGGNGKFYEFYDRDQLGTSTGEDPTDSANRPAIWMRWDGNRPGQTIEWRSETLPEGYIVNDGDDYSRTDYRRIFAAWGTTYGVGDGSTTFGSPDDRGEFKRGWDNGRGVDPGRAFAEHQMDAMQRITGEINAVSPGTSVPLLSTSSGAFTSKNESGGLSSPSSSSVGRFATAEFDSANSPGARTDDSTYPRNNAVIWLTKI